MRIARPAARNFAIKYGLLLQDDSTTSQDNSQLSHEEGSHETGKVTFQHSHQATLAQVPRLPRVSGVLHGYVVATRPLCIIVLDVMVLPLVCLVFAVNLFQLRPALL